MNQVFEQLRESIKGKISELNYNTWFNPIVDANVKDGAFVLVVPNKFVADWINDYYSDLIRQELFSLTQMNYRLSYEIAPDEPPRAPAAASENREPQAVPRARSVEPLNPKYSFDRFVVGSANQFAHAACKAVADLPGGHYNPLFIYGGVGLGKTHLLHAIGIQLMATHPQMHIHYASAEKFMNELINALRNERMEDFRKKHRDRCDVLLLDDVQFLGGKERTQEEFFHTFNALHGSGRQIVVTSDRLPQDIKGIDERLCTRFQWGLIADIGPPDLETRIAILRKKAEASCLKCPDDVAMFLASSIRTNVRELEGSLIRINAFASLTGAQMTIGLAQEILGKALEERERNCTIESVQKIVADYYKINISDLKSPRRTKMLAHPRQVAMYLCKKHVRSSFPEIGNKFGGKDHTTVMHACRKIEKLIEEDAHLQSDIAVIEKDILH
ncbi:MAG: chromosomal replication initiator protein DnaA [Pseudomonadota bacterium]